mgnify:FL=1
MSNESHEIHQQTNTPVMNEFDSKKIVKRDFWLIPIYILNLTAIPIICGIIGAYIGYAIVGNMSKKIFEDYYMNAVTIGSVIGAFILLIVFYLMHKNNIKPIAISRFKALKKHIILIIGSIIMIYVFESFYQILMQFLPEKFQFNDTENNKDIAKMFTHGWLVPFLFLDIVILTPFVEELIFRHLIIHELGKKLTYGLMYIVSILIFASLHCVGAKSPFEIGPYIIIASMIVFVYHKTGRNLAATITMHTINNAVSFLIMVMGF